MLLIIMRLSYQVESSRLSNFVEDKSISKISHFIEKRPAAKDSPPRWLELGIAADYSVVDFHGIRVQQYILALLNIVSNTKRNSVIILRYRIPPPTYVRKQPGNIGQSYAYSVFSRYATCFQTSRSYIRMEALYFLFTLFKAYTYLLKSSANNLSVMEFCNRLISAIR